MKWSENGVAGGEDMYESKGQRGVKEVWKQGWVGGGYSLYIVLLEVFFWFDHNPKGSNEWIVWCVPSTTAVQSTEDGV